MNSRLVVIIGAGVGGLAAAIRLAARGVRVTLLEKGPRVGGKLNLWEAAHPDRPHDRPFRFDTGPSLMTLPFVFKDLFEAAGEDVRDHLPIEKLEPVSRFVWADGATLELSSDERAMLAAVERFAPGDRAGWQRFHERGRHIWELAGEFFLMNAPEQILKSSDRRGMEKLGDGLRMASIPFRIGMFGKYAAAVDRQIKDQRLREVLYQYATYSGASPFLAPATLNVIPFCELHFGGWYIKGGMYALACSLEALARKLNVDIRLNTDARRIQTQDVLMPRRSRWFRSQQQRRVTSVELTSGERVACDATICNADVVWSYEHLIDPADRPHRPNSSLAKMEPGGSGMVLLLGVEGTYPQLAHHTKFMPTDYRSDLRAMFETQTVPADPCIYVCASTRTDPSQAPDGCENLFVLCSAPPLREGKAPAEPRTAKENRSPSAARPEPRPPGRVDGIDWDVEGPRYERQVIETLEHRFGLADLGKRIVVRQRITPADLASRYNAHRGSIYGISSNGLRAAFLRPPNRDPHIGGLYFAGGATHPGGGLPLVALSGKIAAQMAFEDLGIPLSREADREQ